ncbi:MAG: TetR/AcrR family transcriptional regulator [Beutenbergiaceae bacterium]
MNQDFRSKPRRRGAALEAAIIDAAIAELRDVGYAAMTIDSIAKRAGAGKVSIYRRWPNRFELALAAAYAAAGDVQLPPEPSTMRQDLLAIFRFLAAQADDVGGAALRGIVAEAINEADADRVARLSRGNGLRNMSLVVQRARDRGEPVRDNITPLQLMAAPSVLQNYFLTRGNPDEEVLVSVVDDIAIPLLSYHDPE